MIEFASLGGAQTVTGSKHLIRTSRTAVLLDCGLFQGHRQEAMEKNRNLPVDPTALSAVVLSHAHIDHSGALPLLRRQGYRGPIYATPATRDLAAPMLLDTASLQQADARHIARLIARGERDLEPVEPLYTESDVVPTLEQMIGLPYRRAQEIAPGVTLRFLDAGHVLGSAIVVLDVKDQGEARRIAFTGDLGRRHLPILRDPEIPEGVDCLITESTYGDRLHPAMEENENALADIINRTAARGGKVIIPSFALERAQEVVYALKRLRRAGRVAALPVYVDSPLAVKLTDVFRLHPECYDDDARRQLAASDSPFDFPGLRYVSDPEESKAIDADPRPAVVIAANGMCEGGRVLHHLRATVEDPRHTVAIVGFQAQHTLGRRLVERRPEVRIFGVPHHRRAEIAVLNGFSAHADQAGLVGFAEAVRDGGRLGPVILVHGEPPAQEALAHLLGTRGFHNVVIAAAGQSITL
ncbi:MAG TPA: MBL fold metallo-hydrolase [Opitutaceae bacterium]|nr:MBL fold metallo-hydrolase [Opitutaceae bacterium]